MSYLPQNRFVDAVFAYSEGVALFIAGLMIVFGAVILVLAGGYLVVAYFQQLLGVSGLSITALDVINKSEQLMFFAFFGPIEIMVGIMAIFWNALGEQVYQVLNIVISLINSLVIPMLQNVITLKPIPQLTWTVQNTSTWVTDIINIQVSLQAILFPPL